MKAQLKGRGIINLVRMLISGIVSDEYYLMFSPILLHVCFSKDEWILCNGEPPLLSLATFNKNLDQTQLVPLRMVSMLISPGQPGAARYTAKSTLYLLKPNTRSSPKIRQGFSFLWIYRVLAAFHPLSFETIRNQCLTPFSG